MTIITRSLLYLTARRIPQEISGVCIFGREFTSQSSNNSSHTFLRNPVKPSSFPNIVEEEKALANEVLSLDSSSEQPLTKSRVETLFRNLTEKVPAYSSDQTHDDKLPECTTSSSNIQNNNLIIESYEGKPCIPRSQISVWAMAHLYSGYTNPPLVLKAMKELADLDSSTHLVNGVAYGIMSQTAKEVRESFAKNKVDLDLNAYYQRCFLEKDGALPTPDEAYEETLSKSIKELEEAHKLDATNPDVNYYLVSQLLESGNILSGVKLSSRFVTEKEGGDLESMTFAELRALILSSAVSGRSSHPTNEVVQALYHSSMYKNDIDDIIEAIHFVHEHTQSKKSSEILNCLELFRWDPPQKSREI